MPEEKPNLSELYKTGGLDLDLVNKIAHSELEKSKGSNFNSVEALASEYIGVYTYPTASRIIESYIEVLDSELTTEDYQGGKISPEFMLGAAIARGAVAHAQADIEYWKNDIFSRAVTALDDVGLADAARFSCKNADEFSLAGVNPDTKFPIGFVSVREVADTVGERGSEHMKETLKPADLERVAASLAEAEQCIERYELADGIAFNAELEMEKIDLKQGEQGLDEICDAKSEEAELAADDSAVEYGAASNEQSK